jgi:hypothetical protein
VSRRRTLLAFAVAALALQTTSASAGTYDVAACGGAAGGANNAFGAAADPQMAAYTICPNTPSNPATGLVTRASATAGPGWVPYWAGAYQIFEAPPGASLEAVWFDVAVIRLATTWSTGIVTFDNDFNVGGLPWGCYGGPGCGIGTPAFFGPIAVGLGGHTKFRFETRCVAAGGCDISASGFQPGMRALFSAANVTVRVQDSTTPSVSLSGGSLFSGEWLRGTHSGYSAESDNVGIMINRTWVDDRELLYSEDFRDGGWPGDIRCDYTRRRPCNDMPGAGSHVNTRALSDGTHQLRVEAVDAAGNAGSAIRTIKVDNTAPARVNTNVEGGEGWRQTNDFSVSWTNSSDQAAPITTAHYRLCSSGATSDSGPRCTSGSRSDTGIERLSGLSVPGPGEYSLQVWLEDAAGNNEPENASDPVRLRFDNAAPEPVTFELLDERDPLRLDVLIGDSTSGIAHGTIELRRSGFRQWHALASVLEGSRLSARLDDLGLADGSYEARARVSDQAGNERTSDRREDGAKMELTLPVRIASRVTVDGAVRKLKRCKRSARRRARRCPRRRTLRSPRLRGADRTVRGRLETADGSPIALAPIAVVEVPRVGAPTRPAGLQSDGHGRFGFHVARGPSRTIRFQYAGTPLVKPATAELSVLVPARTTIAASKRYVRNGRSVRFSGRLVGRPIPDGGKLIDLQAFYRRRWRTFATPRSDGEGRWRFVYRFEATRGLVRYRFRARIRREAAYPYELGHSRVVRVIVSGP